jgi:hypothetical protein
VEDYTRSLELNPSNIKTFNNRGYSYAKSGNYEAAIADYDQAIQLDPTNSHAYHNRGISFDKLGQVMSGNSVALWFYLKHMMQFERAVSDFTRVIELDSGNANAYFNRGSACVVFLFCALSIAFIVISAIMPLCVSHAPPTLPSVMTLWANSTAPSPTTRTRLSSTWQRMLRRVALKGKEAVVAWLNNPTARQDDVRGSASKS